MARNELDLIGKGGNTPDTSLECLIHFLIKFG